jgi:hypothetical protein
MHAVCKGLISFVNCVVKNVVFSLMCARACVRDKAVMGLKNADNIMYVQVPGSALYSKGKAIPLQAWTGP